MKVFYSMVWLVIGLFLMNVAPVLAEAPTRMAGEARVGETELLATAPLRITAPAVNQTVPVDEWMVVSWTGGTAPYKIAIFRSSGMRSYYREGIQSSAVSVSSLGAVDTFVIEVTSADGVKTSTRVVGAPSVRG